MKEQKRTLTPEQVLALAEHIENAELQCCYWFS